jgi:hypothetical protein
VRGSDEEELSAVLVLGTLGAPQRRLLRGRRGRSVQSAEPEAVPTARATVVRPEPFESRDDAEAWLSELRGDRDAAAAEVARAMATLNRALRAHRVAAADPYLAEVSEDRALVTRIGFGPGDAVAEGRYAGAWELPRPGARTKRSMEAPEERFAAILAGREAAMPAEELVLRARADLSAHRPREAALQARVALESLLADPGARGPGGLPPELEADHGPVGEAANAALRGELPDHLERALGDAVARMEAVLKRRRLGR